jgi:hypothetical protein
MFDISAPEATLLAALVGGLLLLQVHRLNAYRAGSTKFRAEVLSTLSGLYPSPVQWPSDIDASLRSKFAKLQAAITEFRPFLAWYRRRAFDRAWFAYRCATGREIDLQCYHHYIAFCGQPDLQQSFKRNVDALLSFTKQP